MKRLKQAKVKFNQPKTVPKKLVQGQNVIDASKKSPSFAGAQPLLDNLALKHVALKIAQTNLDQASAVRSQLAAVRNAALGEYHMAFGNWGNNVDTVASGQRDVILSTGLETVAGASILPSLIAPTHLHGFAGKSQGEVTITYTRVIGARTYEIQYTDDLTGLDGWTPAPELTGKTSYLNKGMSSGTAYLFRVRALGLGAPGPWSATTQQMAP